MTSAEIDAQWSFADPAASEVRFRELAERLTGEARGEALTQVARALGLQRKFDEAEAILDKVMAAGPRARMRATLEYGRLRNDTKQRDAAERLFRDALRQAENLGDDFYAVDAAHMLGIVVEGEEGLEWNRTAIAMAAESPEARARNWQASLLNNLGWSLHDLGRPVEALEAFVRAVPLRAAQRDEARHRIARWTVGRCLRTLGRFEEALRIQEDLAQDPSADGYVFEEIGECRLALGLPSEGAFRRAYELLSQETWFAEEEPARLERLRLLGEIAYS